MVGHAREASSPFFVPKTATRQRYAWWTCFPGGDLAAQAAALFGHAVHDQDSDRAVEFLKIMMGCGGMGGPGGFGGWGFGSGGVIQGLKVQQAQMFQLLTNAGIVGAAPANPLITSMAGFVNDAVNILPTAMPCSRCESSMDGRTTHVSSTL